MFARTWRFKSSLAHHDRFTDEKTTGLPASFYFVSVIWFQVTLAGDEQRTVCYSEAMTADEVMEYFRATYPGSNIVAMPEGNPTEIICEVDPTVDHADHNTAVAAIKVSTPHYHKKAVETYKVLRGDLKLFVGNQKLALKAGEQHTIEPGQVHHAEGDFALVEVISRPGWTPEDHILVSSSGKTNPSASNF